MSKSLSNHFHGTTGERKFMASQEKYERYLYIKNALNEYLNANK